MRPVVRRAESRRRRAAYLGPPLATAALQPLSVRSIPSARFIVIGPRLWDDLAMVATYDEFAAEHRAEHLKPFNRWCAVVGNPLSVVGGASMLLGHRRGGAALAGSGLAILGAGHIAEGNLPRSLRDLARHPIWSVRADLALARDTIMDSRSRP
jgi:hypothetical protein